MRHRRFRLYRWHRHTQLEVRCFGGFLCLGWAWRYARRPIVYWSPDATPCHQRKRGYYPFRATN